MKSVRFKDKEKGFPTNLSLLLKVDRRRHCQFQKMANFGTNIFEVEFRGQMKSNSIVFLYVYKNFINFSIKKEKKKKFFSVL
jgi:hypothetical protein